MKVANQHMSRKNGTYTLKFDVGFRLRLLKRWLVHAYACMNVCCERLPMVKLDNWGDWGHGMGGCPVRRSASETPLYISTPYILIYRHASSRGGIYRRDICRRYISSIYLYIVSSRYCWWDIHSVQGSPR